MEWIKEGLKLFISRSDKEQKEFEKYNSQIVLGRIRLISMATLCLTIFWVYLDWTIIKSGADKIYTTTLIIMHTIGVIVSAAFLDFYKWIVQKKGNKYNRIRSFIVKLYVFLYILFGALSSINSQLHTGNLYSYIILILIAAVAFSLKPSYMLFAFGANHLIFLIGLAFHCKDLDLLIAKQANATVFVGAATLLGVIFYRQRMVEFFYRKKLKASEENFKRLFYINPYPVLITRLKDGKIIEASKRACSLLGIDEDEIKNYHSIDRFIKNESKAALLEELKENNNTYNRIVEYNFNGNQTWVTANYELIDYHGEKCILTGIMDITEIRKNEEELSHYASTDALTGILNRRMGLKKLEELLEEAKDSPIGFVLCFLDINNLKKVNDTYGHTEGDRYIITLCEIIQSKLQEEDIFFRFGGDEFIIIFRDKDRTQAENIWNKIRQLLNEKNEHEKNPYQIMASHGLFYYSSDMDMDLDEIIEKADKQMYKEKRKTKKDSLKTIKIVK
ncbi:MAG: diguanylate cyclase/phosphodiesterase with sensor [Herbinix sp.]|jgi:diguanylate cyclase (GGDEF)-like protein/PAS domain S-box-containing protein|nr:diguanylate cyclase/phosphodiesterase with sensor [Herbinix sp.]